MDEKDVRGFIKRDEFEQISVPILERVKKPLAKALAEAELTVENIHTVENVPFLVPTFKVREFQVNESFPFPIALSWKVSAADTQNGAVDNQQSTIVFPTGNPIPSVRPLTFYTSGTFVVHVQHADVSELKAPTKINTYTIGPFQSTKGEQTKLKVKICLNLYGIISLESATLLEEEKVEVPIVKESAKELTKMETDEAAVDPAHSSTTETDINMQDAKGSAEVPGAENGVPDVGDKLSQMETDANAEALKKKVKKTSVPVSELKQKIRRMLLRLMLYDMRNMLNDKYHEFVTDSERDQFIAKLQEVEYEDCEDETKGVYIAKLQMQSDPIEERYKEHMERGSVINQLIYCINSYREATMSDDPTFVHIDLAEKQKLLFFCLRTSEKKTEALDRSCMPTMTKPMPVKPTTPKTPSPTSSQGGCSQSQGAENPNSSPNRNPGATETTGTGNEVSSPAAEPMETDKSESAPDAA
ncbi:unnamed protein product [Fraxinus pennsylvanica]|uniref:Uncharacterized protein n=1 Tax=Fraxinus pennsylvanica TaxID=56036 RepID=A0AAD1ZQD2_9LAMI|nr:unnamed protein product [Fraxinus pennsylvanica]